MHGARQYVGVLVHRDGFAGQRRFVYLELGDFDQPQVGRHLVARLQQHDVTRYQGLCLHLQHLAAAHHRRLRRCQPLQRCQRLVGTPGLNKTDGCIEQHDDQNYQGVHQLANHARNDGCGDQHQDHEVAELIDQQRPEAAAVACGQFVGAMQ